MPRPREFNPDDIVEKAMKLFWQKGYLGTSLQDLVDHTEVNRSSLYAVFQDKHHLFLKTLAHYRKVVVPGRLGILERPSANLADIREYFEAVADDMVGPARGCACLMVNTAIELGAHDADAAREITAHLEALKAGFSNALSGAAARGQIENPTKIPAYADYLVSASQGLMVVGKVNPNREILGRIVETSLEALV